MSEHTKNVLFSTDALGDWEHDSFEQREILEVQLDHYAKALLLLR